MVWSKYSRSENLRFESGRSSNQVWSGQSTRDLKTAKSAEALLSLFQKISPDSTTSKLAGILRRDYKLSPIDSIIAATAVTNDLILVTNNKRHYQEISDLRLR